MPALSDASIKNTKPKHFTEFEKTRNIELINDLVQLNNRKNELSEQLEAKKMNLPKLAEDLQRVNDATMKSFSEIKNIGSPEHEVKSSAEWKQAIDLSAKKAERPNKASKEMTLEK